MTQLRMLRFTQVSVCHSVPVVLEHSGTVEAFLLASGHMQ